VTSGQRLRFGTQLLNRLRRTHAKPEQCHIVYRQNLFMLPGRRLRQPRQLPQIRFAANRR
jgi:hypothetical protein